jgi:uncharacterized protein YceK
MPPYRITCLATLALLFCGCGTIANLAGVKQGILSPREDPKYEVYGGIQNDLESARSLFTKDSSKENEKPETVLEQIGHSINDAECFLISSGFLAVELPLSFVGDTLTLPITIQKTLDKQRKQSSGDSTSPDSGK